MSVARKLLSWSGVVLAIRGHRVILVVVVGLIFVSVDVAGATAAARTAPYDRDGAYGGCSYNCEWSATADKTTGDLHAAVAVESPPVGQQSHWPGSYGYWSGYGLAYVTAVMAAGPGTTTWTARLRISAVVEEMASRGNADARLFVGFGVTDTARPYGGWVAVTGREVTAMSDGEVVLQFQLQQSADAVYRAQVVVGAEAQVSNGELASTPSAQLPCLVSRPIARDGGTLCIPPSVGDRVVYGIAEGNASASIYARLDTITVSPS